ncbi:MAG: cobalt-precorrin 5A hydrolase [Deltaproteobacteria bacterium]|nr:cobalt-precorrin 5A hydrolase [Deltaproteobacteria bacterium]
MKYTKKQNFAVWAITAQGVQVAFKITAELADTDMYIPSGLKFQINNRVHCSVLSFNVLSRRLSEVFNQYNGHIFIMSTGIVVRIIAPLIQHKTKDPAVVVVDEKGLYAISLLSGHIGGANELALKIAEITNAEPVITTATDINNIPAIDLLASKKGLIIENPEAIKNVSMALLNGKKIILHDPYQYLTGTLSASNIILNDIDYSIADNRITKNRIPVKNPGVFIDYIKADIPTHFLKLRPVMLAIGMGCNRNTKVQELKAFLGEVLDMFNLSALSLLNLSTIDIKSDEKGLLELAHTLEIPIKFYSKKQLEQVKNIERPSFMVKKHIGVTSVCEAAAILSAKNGKLIVPKQIKGNVTIAIASISSI